LICQICWQGKRARYTVDFFDGIVIEAANFDEWQMLVNPNQTPKANQPKATKSKFMFKHDVFIDGENSCRIQEMLTMHCIFCHPRNITQCGYSDW
jgi:hypothetical protein